MFEPLQESIEEQNRLLREILQKGGLETFLEDVEPVMPHINSNKVFKSGNSSAVRKLQAY